MSELRSPIEVILMIMCTSTSQHPLIHRETSPYLYDWYEKIKIKVFQFNWNHIWYEYIYTQMQWKYVQKTLEEKVEQDKVLYDW